MVRLRTSVCQGNDFGEMASSLLLLLGFANFGLQFFICHDDIAVLS
jgi:hypothetical protein